MRRVSDTLPTLRDAAPAAPDAQGDTEGFDPAIIARVLSGRSGAAAERGEPARQETNSGAPVPGKLEMALARLGGSGQRTRPDSRNQPGTLQPGTAGAGSFAAALAPPEGGGNASRPETAHIPPIDPPQSDVDTRIEEAVAQARAEARAETERAVEAARAEEREAAQRRLEEARANWCQAEGERLAARIDAAFETVHARLSDAFGRAIAPIAEGAVREAAVRRFAAVLDDLAGDGGTGPAVTVTGPHDLLAAVERASAAPHRVTFAPDGTPEATVSIDDTRLETVIGGWAEDLSRAMGQGDE